ncbi:MAG TPA: carbohydrate kinase family protein [Tepidisphaeraceae bacterium]|nr:carbohydrate kinase family protein [Tepidisphaeraceae bacterium]
MKDEKSASSNFSLSFDAAIFGLIVADLIAEPMDLRHPPAAGGLAKLNSLQLATGGNVCNVAIAMAKLGSRVAAAGVVGDDTLGAAMIEKIGAAGVDTSHVNRIQGGQTSATVVAVEPGGERCFFHTPGVCSNLDSAAFEKCFDLFAQCEIVQVGYFGLLPKLTPVLPELLVELKRRAPGLSVAFDTVNPPAKAELLWPILKHVDIFCPSRTEAMAVTGETNPAKMISAFRRWMPNGLIGIKLDSEGCLLDDCNERVMVPAYKVNVVDTTGAGDTWFAGLLVGLQRDMPLEQIGRLANRAAADCCTAFGASAGVRSLDETMARMAS